MTFRVERQRGWSSDVLTQLVSVHGAPQFLRSDNGPEFVATRSYGRETTAHCDAGG
jgi:hypothetical protein